MMFAPRIVYGLVATLASTAFAQPPKQAAEPTKAESRGQAAARDDSDGQQRRALLRASVRSQPNLASAREAPLQSARLLSDQERADLRQQVRQQ